MPHALLQAVARGAGVQIHHCPRAQVHALQTAATTGSAAKTGTCFATSPAQHIQACNTGNGTPYLVSTHMS